MTDQEKAIWNAAFAAACVGYLQRGFSFAAAVVDGADDANRAIVAFRDAKVANPNMDEVVE